VQHAYPQPTLLDVLSPRLSRPATAGRDVALAIAGSLLLTLSAKLQIPFWPVPMTMQTFVVLVLGTAFGWRLGAATVALYLLEGALGLPVFAGTPERGIGLAYMTGPTGGYLAGFLAAAMLCGRLAERGWDRSMWRTALAMTIGHVLILFLGWAWLAVLIGPEKAYLTGVAPFYAATVAKTLLAVVARPLAWKLSASRTSR
jgi:biotin transport system substrate-specific component